MKNRLFFDMDGVLVDFQSGLNKVDQETLNNYKGRVDEIPGLFGLMDPMPGAIDAVNKLKEHYDCYILSTAPWGNPSAWMDKVIWIKDFFGDTFKKRVTITHCKNFSQGDILIDDRSKHGADQFVGEWIQFGQGEFKDWDAVLKYLLP